MDPQRKREIQKKNLKIAGIGLAVAIVIGYYYQTHPQAPKVRECRKAKILTIAGERVETPFHARVWYEGGDLVVEGEKTNFLGAYTSAVMRS